MKIQYISSVDTANTALENRCLQKSLLSRYVYIFLLWGKTFHEDPTEEPSDNSASHLSKRNLEHCEDIAVWKRRCCYANNNR